MASKKLSSDTSLANSYKLSRGVASVARPSAPTIGTATDGGTGNMSVTFTASTLGPTASSYTLLSSSGVTGSGASSPLTLQEATVGTYTYTVSGVNANGTGPSSAASNSVNVASLFAPSGAYDSIATASGTGASGTITFSSIPATYTHLEIRQISRCSIGSSDCNVRFNGDTASNYSWHRPMFGNGSSATAAAAANTTAIECPPIGYSGLAANVYGVSVISILDYANTSKYKTLRALGGHEDNTVVGALIMNTGNWRNTAAITSIELFTGGGSWTTDSHFALYGIKGA